MKYLFIGLGSIGMRHLQNLRELTDDPIYALRTKVDKYIDEQFKIKSITSLQEALDLKPDVVFITNPTSKHLQYALMFCYSHLFIEKPLSVSNGSFKVIKLFSTLKENKKICFVGFNYRFHPELIRIKKQIDNNEIGKVLYAHFQTGQYLPAWQNRRDYWNSYSARKDLGGGALLTMCHDIDYAYWLLGNLTPLYAIKSKISSLKIDVEDSISIMLKTKSNASVDIHLDYLQIPYSRTIKIVGENKTINWNHLDKYDKEDYNQMYFDELRHFLNCVKGKEKPIITQNDIINVMKIIDKIKKVCK